MRGFLTILFLLITSISFGQGFAYTYVDPCTKKLNTITIPAGQSTVTFSYLGQARTFTKTELEDGTFNMWLYSVQQSSSEPCGEFKGETQKTQNIIITSNIISTLTSVTAVSTMTVASTIGGISSQGAGNAISNSVDNSSENSSGDNKSSKKDKNGGNTNNPTNSSNNPTNSNGGQNGGGQGTNTNPNNGTSQEGGNNSNTNQPSQTGNQPNQPSVGQNSESNPPSNPPSQGGTNGGNTGSGNGNTGSGSGGGNGGEVKPKDPTTPNTEEKSGGNGGTTNSVANAAESSSGGNGGGKGNSRVRVGSIIGTGDIVAIRSNEDGLSQFRATMSVTKSNTDNTKAKGALLNFTTAINNSNLTFYGAFTNKNKSNTLIFANSSMINFNYDFFNTTTVLESHRWGKLSLMGGANFTVGTLAEESFSNLSAVGGGFYLFNVGKKVTGNLLVLAVYSPFTKFYEGTWWESGTLLVPFSSWDYTISKNFKFNVSFSGTWEVNKSVLQYQILTGGKILL